MMWIVTIEEVDVEPKPSEAVEIRRREVEEAREASARAWKAWIKAKVDCENARVAWKESRTTYNQAWKVYREAGTTTCGG